MVCFFERVEEEAVWVRFIFRQRAQGASLHAIAAELNKRNIPTPQGGKKWYARTVKIIVDNEPLYRGKTETGMMSPSGAIGRGFPALLSS
jgi:Recombinase